MSAPRGCCSLPELLAKAQGLEEEAEEEEEEAEEEEAEAEAEGPEAEELRIGIVKFRNECVEKSYLVYQSLTRGRALAQENVLVGV